MRSVLRGLGTLPLTTVLAAERGDTLLLEDESAIGAPGSTCEERGDSVGESPRREKTIEKRLCDLGDFCDGDEDASVGDANGSATLGTGGGECVGVVGPEPEGDLTEVRRPKPCFVSAAGVVGATTGFEPFGEEVRSGVTRLLIVGVDASDSLPVGDEGPSSVSLRCLSILSSS